MRVREREIKSKRTHEQHHRIILPDHPGHQIEGRGEKRGSKDHSFMRSLCVYVSSSLELFFGSHIVHRHMHEPTDGRWRTEGES